MTERHTTSEDSENCHHHGIPTLGRNIEVPQVCCRLALCKIQNGAETHDDIHGHDDVPEQDLLPSGGDSLEQRHCETGLAQRAADDDHKLANIDKLKG